MLTKGQAAKGLIAAIAGAGCIHWRAKRARREASSVIRPLRAESHDQAGGKPASIFSGGGVVAASPPALKDGVSRGGTDDHDASRSNHRTLDTRCSN
jgi:hypothetical protein